MSTKELLERLKGLGYRFTRNKHYIWIEANSTVLFASIERKPCTFVNRFTLHAPNYYNYYLSGKELLLALYATAVKEKLGID